MRVDQGMGYNKDDGGPAFPYPAGHIECKHPEGMSLRDYFAAAALQGWVANTKAMVDSALANENGANARNGITRLMYQFADAMLEATEK